MTQYFSTSKHNKVRLASLIFLLASLSVPVIAKAGLDEPEACNPAGTLRERLSCLDGVRVTNITSQTSGYQVVDLMISQPVDHDKPDDGRFEQRLVLFHRDFNAPMVLQTSGYAIFSKGLASVAQKFRTNQIQVEHRFFANSVPKGNDWSYLNIKQSANDFHRITTVFKTIYGKRWVGTGASKGGMTSVYHRYFFPNDLDGTLALVAPLSYATDDQRYVEFLEQVGGDRYASCRAKLESAQRGLLAKKSQILPSISGRYDQLGTKEIAFEHAVIELPFAFWQYGNPSDCASVPEGTSSASSLFAFLERANAMDSYSDSGMSKFVPYYVQAAQQLGAPGAKFSHIQDLATYLSTYDIVSYIPKDASPHFDASVMPAVQDWVRTESHNIMYIYGEFDPWTAAAFVPGEPKRENYFFLAPKANHGANIDSLSSSDRAKAMTILSSWFGVKAEEDYGVMSFAKPLEAQEFEFAKAQKRKL